MIALFCMTLDHLAVTLAEPLVIYLFAGKRTEVAIGMMIVGLMRCIGRVAFPIYCFFIYEGFKHTRSKLKYMLRLFILAIISEVPFNLALAHRIFSYRYQNVFWTLLLGLIVIVEIDGINKIFKNKYLILVSEILTISSGMIIAELANTDYGANGVFAIVIIWLMSNSKLVTSIICHIVGAGLELLSVRFLTTENIILHAIMFIVFVVLIYQINKRTLNKIKGVSACCLELTVNNSIEIFSFLMIPLMLLYNGEKGKMNKWFFYFYYPVHLALFTGIGFLIGVYS